jgi:biotin carboxyl carrier protein
VKLDIEIDGVVHQVAIEAPDGSGTAPVNGSAPGRIQIDGQPVDTDACFLRPGVLSLLIGGRSYCIVLDDDLGAPVLTDPIMHLGAERITWQADDPRSLQRRRRHAAADGPVTLKASMPGRVVRVLLAKGEMVAAHQGVIVIEAMKMQNELKSPKEGRIADLRVAPGDTVASGEVLAIIE